MGRRIDNGLRWTLGVILSIENEAMDNEEVCTTDLLQNLFQIVGLSLEPLGRCSRKSTARTSVHLLSVSLRAAKGKAADAAAVLGAASTSTDICSLLIQIIARHCRWSTPIQPRWGGRVELSSCRSSDKGRDDYARAQACHVQLVGSSGGRVIAEIANGIPPRRVDHL